ncbi:MAG: UDP-3-O-(3-hydroxymyristoyl)glucosamine N-acyltransferase [Planctomycetes bacterium]|nr:UDP-3-O-(3-hydroxymyristoyl)glucosamine N-acyltransferase [Planctomycetota bacterium]
MEFPIGAIAKMLGGELLAPEKAGVIVNGVASLDTGGPGDLAFLWNPDFAEQAKTTKAEVVVTAEAIEGVPCILVKDPQAAMLLILQQLYALRHPAPKAGVHPKAHVEESATLGEGVSVGATAVVEAQATIGAKTQIRPGAYIGRGAQIGKECVIHPNATILDYVQVGDRTTIWSGAVIGKDGFGFVPNSGDRRDLSKGTTRIPQIGTVTIGDDCEVGATATIARGALDNTVVGDQVVIDDQVFIAHGCHVEQNVVMLGRSGLSGGAKVEKNTYIMGGACIGLGRTVGEGSIVGSGAVVIYSSVAPGSEVLGAPHRPAMQERRLQVTLSKLSDQLPDLRKRVKKIEKKLAE